MSGLAWLREEGASAATAAASSVAMCICDNPSPRRSWLVEIVAEPQAQQLPLSIGQFRDGGMLVEMPFGESD